MRKILLLVALPLMLASAAFSQVGNPLTLPLRAGDTTVNAGTASKIITATGNYSGAVIQVDVTKISGTVGGTVQIQGSLTGASGSYKIIGSTQTVTDGNATYYFFPTGPLPKFIKVLQTGAATMSAVFTVSYMYVPYTRN